MTVSQCELISTTCCILLNKTDLCSKEQLASVKRAIKKLNKTAKLIETVNSVVNLTEVINTGIFDHKNLELDARGWRKEEEDPEERGPEDVITSFVYKRDRPFHPDRLHELMSTAFMIDIQMPEGQEECGIDHNHDNEEEDSPEERAWIE